MCCRGPDRKTAAARIYSFVLRFYPREHREKFGLQMLQSFQDSYDDEKETVGIVSLKFWLDMINDEAKSILRERIFVRKGGPPMRSYTYGLVLGILLLVVIVISNVLFPNFKNDSEYETIYPIVAGLLVFFFVIVGFLAGRRAGKVVVGTKTGALTAVIGIGIAMLTYFVVDNVFINIVSKQPDKLYGFQHSSFQTMRDYINNGLLKGAITMLPLVGAIGAVCGSIGAFAGKLIAPRTDRI